MATSGDVCAILSVVMREPAGTVMAIGQNLRAAGIIHRSGRGRATHHLEDDEVAAWVIAVACTPTIHEAASAAAELISARPTLAADKRKPPLAAPIAHLWAPVWAQDTFGAMFAGLLRLASAYPELCESVSIYVSRVRGEPGATTSINGTTTFWAGGCDMTGAQFRIFSKGLIGLAGAIRK